MKKIIFRRRIKILKKELSCRMCQCGPSDVYRRNRPSFAYIFIYDVTEYFCTMS